MSKNTPIRYFAYCRKSSEDSQRQVASIGDQESAIERMVSAEGLTLAASPFTEERSSKDPGRPVFNEMLDRIDRREADGILCWDIDRLYRNPVDEGRLRWMLQRGVVRVIRTPSRSFFPEDAGLLMGVEGGRATDYVIRLSKNVKRGLAGKASRGWRPSGAPIGYLNVGERGSRTIVVDPVAFELVRRMWDLYLTGTYLPSEIRRIATEEWGLRTKVRRRLGGKPLSMSHVYKIFNDPFYYGRFEWTDPETGDTRLMEGKHQPMITEQEFRRAQLLLGKKGKHQPQRREFAFTGLITCGRCESGITAEEKHQTICSGCRYKFASGKREACPRCGVSIEEMKNPTRLFYTYYHCTHRKDSTCREKFVRLEDLERQVDELLAGITIDDDYLQLALEYLQDKQRGAVRQERSARLSLQSAFDACQTRLANLHREYTSPQNADYGIYTPEEFKAAKAELVAERDGLRARLEGSQKASDDALAATERVFNFCASARARFRIGDLKTKRAILGSLGSNLTIRGGKLSIEKLHPFLLVERELADQRKLLATFEPNSELGTKERAASFETARPSLLRLVEAVRTWIEGGGTRFFVPNLQAPYPQKGYPCVR